MPQFSMKDGIYFVTHVTGPTHLLLGLGFDAARTNVKFVKVSSRDSHQHVRLVESEIHKAVSDGIASARSGLGFERTPSEIHDVENDSPRYELFSHCAYLIAERLQAGAEFQVSNN